jgi:serine/threonine-protein kinase
MNAHQGPEGNGGCPTADDLLRFAAGRLPADVRETIARHIDGCPDCLAALERFDGQHDPLLADLRQPVPADLFTIALTGPPAVPGPAGLPEVPGYRLLGELGRGAMGVVYQAWHLDLGRPVALKMILAGEHAGPDDLARFRTEAQAVARLSHPHIVQIFEVGEHAGLPFFALEYLEGGSLDCKVRDAALPAAEAAALVQMLAEAMQAAHERGIVHRDLKPANVLLDRDGRPKVTDFGLARRIDAGPGQTRSGAIVGTPSYMAPEQAAGRGKEAGPAADVYALGAILYESPP